MRRCAPIVCCALLAACATTELPAPADPRCERVASLAAAGEHKPAVDELALLTQERAACPEPVVAAVAESRATLSRADALVREAVAKRDRGDLAAARQGLRQALEIYPKYYWAEKLRRDLEAGVTGEAADFREEAQRLLEEGDPQGALEQLERAAGLAGTNPQLASELGDLRRRIVEKHLALARSAEQQEDLAEAERRIGQALQVPFTDTDLKRVVVDRARLLGLKLFSAGELTRAKSLWAGALSLDRTNDKLREYLQEVEDRLESLGEIESEDPDSGRR